MRKPGTKVISLLAAFLFATSAFAASGKMDQLIASGTGIVAPSVTASLGENPAGLMYNNSQKIVGYLSSNASSLSGGGGYFVGNGSYGSSLAVIRGADGGLDLSFGLSILVPGLNTAFGLSTQGLGGEGLNIGALFNPRGDLRGGLLLFDTSDGIDVVGAGLAYALGQDALLSVDGAFDLNQDFASLKPGIRVQVSQLHLSTSYGFALTDSGGVGQIQNGFTVGAGLDVGNSLHVQAYYNHLAEYYAGLLYSF